MLCLMEIRIVECVDEGWFVNLIFWCLFENWKDLILCRLRRRIYVGSGWRKWSLGFWVGDLFELVVYIGIFWKI